MCSAALYHITINFDKMSCEVSWRKSVKNRGEQGFGCVEGFVGGEFLMHLEKIFQEALGGI